jgi:hypothetical protein
VRDAQEILRQRQSGAALQADLMSTRRLQARP